MKLAIEEINEENDRRHAAAHSGILPPLHNEFGPVQRGPITSALGYLRPIDSYRGDPISLRNGAVEKWPKRETAATREEPEAAAAGQGFLVTGFAQATPGLFGDG